MTAAITALPLLGAASPRSIVAYRDGRGIEAAHFLADVADLAARLPDARHVLNVCTDRYRFAVGFAACLTSGRVSLLPSTYTPEVVRRLGEFAPDAICLTDSADCDIELPHMPFPHERRIARVSWQIPRVDADRLAAIVFTSGSTGLPLPYRKTWRRLADCVQAGARQLGLDGADGGARTIVGTVPAQHMYGFESTLLLALLGGHPFAAERPFYPADIVACLELAPRPRVLVSTPVHLRALLAAETRLPGADLIVSATAPLERELAREVEGRFGCELVEIYGSTETGQIATRRTASSAAWRLWPGVRLGQLDATTFAEGGHVEQRTALCDVIEILNEREFLLLGRTADLVNVAGKRSSFAYLDHQLNSIPGVLDGAFFLREETSAGEVGVTRLGAAVVAPGWDAASLQHRLRECIDAAFLPRPLMLVERLPRNATGKLPRHALQALLAEHRQGGGRA